MPETADSLSALSGHSFKPLFYTYVLFVFSICETAGECVQMEMCVCVCVGSSGTCEHSLRRAKKTEGQKNRFLLITF